MSVEKDSWSCESPLALPLSDPPAQRVVWGEEEEESEGEKEKGEKRSGGVERREEQGKGGLKGSGGEERGKEEGREEKRRERRRGRGGK